MKIRSFRLPDFPFLAQAMDEEWGWELKDCTQSERDALAVFYSAAAVGSCNVVLTAVNEEEVPCAFLCAEVFRQDKNDANASHWRSLMTAAQTQLQASPAGREVLRFYERIAAVNIRLLEQVKSKGIAPQAELRFFITAPSARGRGAGKALLTSFGDYLRQSHVSVCLLFTDSHCSWQYYEKNGWRRSAFERWECEGETIDAFAYVKDF